MKKEDVDSRVEKILDLAMLSLSEEAFDVVLEARKWQKEQRQSQKSRQKKV